MKTHKPKALVLGADGFIGSNLIKSLLKDKKYSVRGFDLFKDGQSRNLEDVSNDIEIFAGNFLNREDIRNALIDVDYVFHFISLTTPGSSYNDPLMDVDTNIRGTIALLDECADAKVKKIIFPSSGGSIYGNNGKEFLDENDSTNPISPYAISKLTIEKYLEYYRVHRGLNYLILRYANPYGAGQNVVGSQGIIPIFLNLVMHGKPITIFGDGENVRDYIYIDDAIEITKRIFDKTTEHRVYNLGSGKGASINDVIDIIKEVTGKKIETNNELERSADVKRVVLNIDRIANEIGDLSTVNLREGIEKTWRWLSNIR
ncbi:MAG: UDP-glucose 4-epimerase [Candidatus Wolfebacteria bacterium GW2011_GWC2_39_22]|uniref:UDP-glucose 4-epimerase n=1 Tax=Candidatus Wolfebacteria bacterium GW2011_GWC2_39_22 TaxID=1619013 RepID=A0A0G0N9A4_9BACT|nr:MAG: UDP-glucose 4-epimerase [Candidatus Wolfebacteria bacterium GW2011_GWC2_39_22]